jgi:hypothetical protein
MGGRRVVASNRGNLSQGFAMALPRRCAASLRLADELSINLVVYDRGSETLRKEGIAAGKSETCRASAWQSQRAADYLLTDN